MPPERRARRLVDRARGTKPRELASRLICAPSTLGLGGSPRPPRGYPTVGSSAFAAPALHFKFRVRPAPPPDYSSSLEGADINVQPLSDIFVALGDIFLETPRGRARARARDASAKPPSPASVSSVVQGWCGRCNSQWFAPPARARDRQAASASARAARRLRGPWSSDHKTEELAGGVFGLFVALGITGEKQRSAPRPE